MSKMPSYTFFKVRKCPLARLGKFLGLFVQFLFYEKCIAEKSRVFFSGNPNIVYILFLYGEGLYLM